MKPERQIYLLDPKQLSPETIAVTFAKTSRSPQSFREIAAELTDEQSSQFHEKWVVGYGHSSVAEHAVLHIAIENVSRLAIETIEGNRLASYTEKSTRYQKWSPGAFYTPPELFDTPLLETYYKTVNALFDAYQRSLPVVRAWVEGKYPRKEGESEAAWDRRMRSAYVDICRFLLPAAALANVGVTANARVLEYAIAKMLSSPLMEVRQIGEEVKRVARAEAPTLVKYADALPYLQNTSADFMEESRTFFEPLAKSTQDWCQLIRYSEQGEVDVLAAALYRFGEMPYTNAREAVAWLAESERAALVEKLLARLGEHDIPLRELEHCTYTFDVLMDQGAYFEVKRHRMMTQTPQHLTALLGYACPVGIYEAGFEKEYRQAMEMAERTYRELATFNPEVAAYVVPNGFNRRVLLHFNLRSAYHFCALRSSPGAHFSVRRVALRIAEEIRRVHPNLAAYLRLPEGETWQSVERACLV